MSNGPTTTHLFCGAGGDVRGFERAGYEPVALANHDPVSIATVTRRFPKADARCVDLDHYNMASLPRTQILVGSPICTEIAQAGGNTAPKAQMSLIEEEGSASMSTWERTRLTAWDLIRAAEAHRYDMVLGENVPEFATRWILFDTWLRAWDVLGYNATYACVNAAHIAAAGSQPVPQLRNRLLFAFTRKGLKQPDLRPRPDCLCKECGPVLGVQRWRNPNPRARKIGKYGEQYDYVCPNRRCGHLFVEPVVWPVEPIIDWDLPGRRIGDGKPYKKFTPYAEKTLRKVAIGLERFKDEPFLALLRKNLTVQSLDMPIPTVTAGGKHFALIVHIGRKTAPRTTNQPLSTVATHPHHALVGPNLSVEDSTIRMLAPAETKLAQGFDHDYYLHGNVTEQQLQVGNAVPVTVAEWFGQRALAVYSR